MLEDLLALIAPPACAVCGDGCEVRRRLCERCERALRGQAPVWSASLIAGRVPCDRLGGPIVPGPAAPGRHRRRGFDAAEAIAASLAKRTGLALAPCLSRTQSARQVGRRRSERG